MKNSQGYTLLKAFDCVSDDAVADAMISDDAIVTASRPKRRHAIAAFFEKPAVVAAICAVVALGTVTGIVMAGRAAGKPVPPISGTVDSDHPSHETEFTYVGDIIRHEDLYYVSHGNGTCSLVGIAALPEDMVLTIPETAMNGDRVIALRDMTMTSSLAVPNGVHLFQVKGIHIPASMTSVHINTLHEMTALESLTVNEGNPVYRSEQNCLIERDQERLVYSYAQWLVIVYTGTPSHKQSPLLYFYIPDSVKIIARGALNEIVSVNMLEKIDVDISDFESKNLTCEIPIPASVEHIEERFFLNHDYSPIELRVDEKNRFYYTEGNCLIHKDSNTVILGGKNAKIPDSVTAIAPYAFEGAGLTSIHIPASVQSIGELAFWNNPDLESITGDLGEPIMNPDESGYWSCYYVKNNCLIYEGDNIAFSSLTQYRSAVVLGCANSIIPENVTRIDDFAFAWNQGLTEINLPSSLQSIGFKAFAHCPNLATIRYGGTYEQWCQLDLDDTWIYGNGQMTELYFTDQDIPMTVVGVEFNNSGKEKNEN